MPPDLDDPNESEDAVATTTTTQSTLPFTSEDTAPTTSAAVPKTPPPSDEQGAADDTADQADQGAAEAESDFISIRDAAKNYGLDLSGYADDAAAMQAISEQVRRSRQIEELYRQHLADQATQATRQPEPAKPEKPKLWDPPEFQHSWLQQVREGEDGNLEPIPGSGGSLETVSKVLRYKQYLQDQSTKFWQNPYEFIAPFVEEKVTERAQQLIDNQLNNYSGLQTAQTWIERNSDWLFRKDAAGNQQMTEDGLTFQNYLEKSKNWNMPQPERIEYAMDQLNAWRAKNSAGTHQATNQQKKDQFLKNAAGYTPDAAGTTNKSPRADGSQPAQNPHLSINEQLEAAFKAHGITDEDFKDFSY